MSEALEDPRQRARELAFRHLVPRDRSIAEIESHLTAREVDPATIAAVVEELCRDGYLDDASFARRFAEDRRRLEGWGADRVARRLEELGVERAHIVAALARGPDEPSELEAAVALLQRRYGPEPLEEPRELERALGVLVRKGYELELAHDALRAHGRDEDPD
jgi:regulatory protein